MAISFEQYLKSFTNDAGFLPVSFRAIFFRFRVAFFVAAPIGFGRQLSLWARHSVLEDLYDLFYPSL